MKIISTNEILKWLDEASECWKAFYPNKKTEGDEIKGQIRIQMEGKTGEGIIRGYLKSMGAKIHQVDWMGLFPDNKYREIEVKYQEIFTPGKVGGFHWDHHGTGLPYWQVEARMDFYKNTGIVPWLFVVEKSNYEKKEGHHLIWTASLPDLERKEHRDTTGADPRRVYNIESFNKIYFAKKDK